MKDYLLFEAEKTVELLKRRNKSVSCAESCTGGMLSQYITAVPGASFVFEMGVCAYSSRIKHNILGVKSQTLEKHGAVSRHTAAEMALRVRAISGADIGVSITGVAGPEPSEGKQPGTVYIALADGKDIRVEKLTIDPESREAVRKTACSAVFAMICKSLDIA